MMTNPLPPRPKLPNPIINPFEYDAALIIERAYNNRERAIAERLSSAIIFADDGKAQVDGVKICELLEELERK